MVYNKQFITLGHCEIWRHFTRTLYFHSPMARDNTVATREISRLRNRRDMKRAFDWSFG